MAEEVRLGRAMLGMTRQQAAVRARVSWSTVARAERGSPGLALDTMCAVAAAVGLDLVVRLYPGQGPSLRDSGQLAVAEQLVAQLDGRWRPTLELSVGPHGEAIDLVLFGTDEILAVEIERALVDFQAQYRRADSKRQILAATHRRPVRLIIAVEDTRRNRAAVAPHAGFIGSGLPAGSRRILRAFRSGGALSGDGLLWWRRR